MRSRLKKSRSRATAHEAIDYTQLAIAHAPTHATSFSFWAIGDTDAGAQSKQSTQSFSHRFAEQVLRHIQRSEVAEQDIENNPYAQARPSGSFLLHTGDITYPIGSYQNYLEGFLRPYESLLLQSPASPKYCGKDVVFKRPLLTVPGNHDYATPSGKLWFGRKWLRGVCDFLRQFGIDFGHYGGEGGEAYENTFLDDTQGLSSEQLSAHLATHYSARARSCDSLAPYCLQYAPGKFTRLPNRYYRFRYGGVEFFALDSNTWNTSPEKKNFDQAQLDWLSRSLIESWQSDIEAKDDSQRTVARVLYLHHSPYTTEESRWQQSETLWVRRHLRTVLDNVSHAINRFSDKNSADAKQLLQPVNLIISGHAHCFEHIKTRDTGHADSSLDWIVCGGSGKGIRRQRADGTKILETISESDRSRTCVVADSVSFAGKHGSGRYTQTFHSFVQVKVCLAETNKIIIRPFVVARRTNQITVQQPVRALSPIEIDLPPLEPSSAYRPMKVAF